MSHAGMKPNKYTQFLTAWSGTQLLKKHTLDEVGVWEVRGEDPNCDFGGSHYNPLIGHFEGQLDDVIRRVVDHPQFWTWGSGGCITKITIQQVKHIDEKTQAEINKLKQSKKHLERQINDVNVELSKYE